MAKAFKLEIVTPDRMVYTGEITSLVVPAANGYLGVLAGHAPLLCAIKPGEIKIEAGENTVHYTTSGGFMEVTPTKTILLSDSSEEVNAIDIERALKSKERAHARLHKREKGTDFDRAQAALERAENRLRVAQRGPGKEINS